jgi:RNA polymerase sigma factor (TIGR02999 family)
MKISAEITELLQQWQSGDNEALEKLIPLVMVELRQIAKGRLRLENRNHAFQTTELVNELFLKLVKSDNLQILNRSHFFAICANCIRQILIDYARSKSREKRGGSAEVVSIDDVQIMTSEKSIELIALDEALQQLEKHDPQKSRIVELRYFGGLTVEEVAEVLGISKRTVERDWQMAKAWLATEMKSLI